MKHALVIHPRFTLYGGGEAVGLHVCKVLQELDYRVYLACDNFNPDEAEQHLGLGEVMRNCIYLPTLGEFKPRFFNTFLAYQRAIYGMRLLNSIKIPQDCDFVLSTQAILYFKPSLFNFCVAYDTADFFYASEMGSMSGRSFLKTVYYQPLRQLYGHYASRMSQKENFYIPLSRALERYVDALHYPHSSRVFPPCDMSFKAKPKERYVVNTSRLVPSKKLDDFVQVAKQLPQYDFIIVGKMSRTEEEIFPTYKRRLIESLPVNVKLIEARIRDRKELVEAARLYLYPSVEAGISISLGQAMAAGCVPVTPWFGGGAEMVEDTDTGYTYHTLDEAVQIVKRVLEHDFPRDRPERVAQHARIFSADSFEKHVRNIIEERLRDREVHPR